MSDAPSIERLGEVLTDLGECPLWDAAAARLWLMDCRRGTILRMDPRTGECERVVEVPPPAGSFAFNADGRLVVALKEEVALVDPATGAIERLARIDDSHPHLRLNDGTALADGSFVVGTMHPFREPGEPPLGGLYRLSPDGAFVRFDRGYGVANGPRTSPIDGRLHVCDSAAQAIWSYAIAPDGSIGDRRRFVDTGPHGSAPDGCCFDTEGGLWTALVRAGALARFAPDGRLTHRIALPLAHPTAPCFGGPDFNDLFVTSIRDSGRLKADGPLDGAVLRVRGAGPFRGYPPPVCRLGAR